MISRRIGLPTLVFFSLGLAAVLLAALAALFSR
jgi:hypothetical protein